MFVKTGRSAGTALRGATTVAAGGAHDLGACYHRFTLQTTVSGTVVTLTVLLQGSLDGAAWFTLGTTTAVGGEAIHAFDKPAQFVRANVTVISGSGATVNAMIGAA